MSSFQNKIIRLSSPLIVDSDILFENCQIYADDNQQITITNSTSKSLSFRQTTITSCLEMWGGIVIKQKGSIKMCGGAVKNALTGISFYQEHMYSSSIVGVTFYNNRVGIHSTYPNHDFNFAKFYLNYFDGGFLLPPVYADWGIVAEVGSPRYHYAAIMVENSIRGHIGINPSNILGNNIGYNNSIESGYFGIILKNATCVVQNAFIQNQKTSKYIDNSNTAIFTQQSRLKVTGKLINGEKDGNVVITNVKNGILTDESSHTEVWYAYIEKCRAGIVGVNNLVPARIQIRDSEIILDPQVGFPQGAGIYQETAPDGVLTNPYFISEVKDNVIKVQNVQAPEVYKYGIHIQNVFAQNKPFNINYNHISFEGNNSGLGSGIKIDANIAKRFAVTNNTITLGTDAAGWKKFGIELNNLNAGGNQLSYNTITGGSNSHNTEGIRLWNAPGASLCYNTTETTRMGVHAFGDNDNLKLRNNTMKNNFNGLQIDGSGARIGAQFRRGNRWEGTFSNKAAILIGNAFQSRIETESNDPIIKPTNITPMTGWFFQVDGPLDHCSPGFSEGGDDDLSLLEKGLVEGTAIASADLPSSSIWDGERRLMDKMYKQPALKTISAQHQQFFTQKDMASSGAFARVEMQMQAAMQLANEYMASQFHTNANLIAAMEAQLDAVATQPSETDILKLSELHTERNAIASQIIENRASIFNGLEPYIAALPEQTIYEKYRKTILQIRTKHYSGKNLDKNDVAILHSIASDCWDMGGAAVIEAIGLLPPDESVVYADYKYVPCTTSNRESDFNAEREVTPLTIYPNPAADRLQVYFGTAAIGNWEIIDMYGKAKKQGEKPLEALSATIEVADLDSGAYFLRYTTSLKRPRTAIFSITR